jgi:hypothetical protein
MTRMLLHAMLYIYIYIYIYIYSPAVSSRSAVFTSLKSRRTERIPSHARKHSSQEKMLLNASLVALGIGLGAALVVRLRVAIQGYLWDR